MTEASLLHHPWITRRKLDVTEYHRMGEAGILTADDRVELIEGEILAMSPIGTGHAGAVIELNGVLVRGAGSLALVSVQNPVRLDRYSEPEPDFALLRPRPGGYRNTPATPADVLLLIEIAESSLRFDRLVKLPLYARHGIPELWIVDLVGGVVEVCRAPGPTGYAEITHAMRGDNIAPQALPALTLSVDTILG